MDYTILSALLWVVAGATVTVYLLRRRGRKAGQKISAGHANSPDVIRPELSSRVIIIFVSLQALDVITTLIGIRVGAQETNIVVARLMDLGPTTGLLIAKLLGILIILAVFVRGKLRLIRLCNFLFAGIVTWNLVMIGIQRWVVLTR